MGGVKSQPGPYGHTSMRKRMKGRKTALVLFISIFSFMAMSRG